MADTTRKDVGEATAYAYAVAGGYVGTKEEFEEALANASITVQELENLSAVAVTLAPGSEATASYSDGVLTFGIPQGATGETGQTGPQGPEGPTGNGIVSITKTGTSGLVDTYTITFTDGTTTTFTVTNGADGDITNVAAAFSTTKAYSVGDMVLYQGALYAFTAAHTAGTWIGTDAQAVVLSDVVTELKSDFNKIETVIETGEAIIEEITPTFEMGTIHGSSYGNHSSSTNTAFMLEKLYVGDTYSFNAANYKLALVGYKNDGTYVSVGGFETTSPVTIQSNTSVFSVAGVDFACAQFRKSDGSDLSSSDLTAINFKITRNGLTPAFPTKEYVDENFVSYDGLAIYNIDNNISKRLPVANAWGDATVNNDGTITIGVGKYYFINYDVSVIKGKIAILINTTATAPIYVNVSDSLGNGGSVAWQTESYGANKQMLVVDASDITTKYIVIRLDNRSSQTGYTVNSVIVGDITNNQGIACYVSSAGNNANDGTKEKPFASVQYAIDSGYHNIFVEVGTYSEPIRIENKSNISLVPYGYGTYDASLPDTAMVHVSGGDNPTLANMLAVLNSSDIYIEGFWFDNTLNNCADIRNSSIEMLRCYFSNAATNNGLYLYNVNGVFRDCLAYNIALDSGTSYGDGFNIHGYGDTQFINCVAHDCNDDGISHHEGCTGAIIGGEFYNCGKGGVASPTHGAKVNVCGVYSHDNAYGIYLVTDSGGIRCKSKVYDCALNDNTTDLAIINSDVVGWNNKYTTTYIPTASDYTEIT